MAQGYSPSCPNCHRCGKCSGSGVVTNVRYDKNWQGNTVKVEERATCPTCRGVGGRVGVGKHDHR